jgi:hypothetical protein
MEDAIANAMKERSELKGSDWQKKQASEAKNIDVNDVAQG